jgi:Flp pilus assembly protein TadB
VGKKRYPDPEEHLTQYMERAAERYMDGLSRAGLKPNDRLTRAMARRALHSAQEDYMRQARETRDHNINAILREHHREMNEIKRRGHQQRLWMCPLIAGIFAGVAYYNLVHTHDLLMAAICAAFALAFLLMLILGAIFDRPGPID